MPLKYHLNHFGAAREGGAAVGGESSALGDVLVGMASQLDLCQRALIPCGHSRASLEQQDGRRSCPCMLLLWRFRGALRRHQWPCVEQLNLQGLMPLTAQPC